MGNDISNLFAVEVIMKHDGSKRYAAGVGWEGASVDITHCGSPIHHRELSNWKKIPITDLEYMFPDKYDHVVKVLLDPKAQDTFYLGAPTETHQ